MFVLQVAFVTKKLYLTDGCERNPLFCISSDFSRVLGCISAIAASMVGLRRVSKVCRYDLRGYTVTSCCACGGICCETLVSCTLHWDTNAITRASACQFFVVSYLIILTVP